MDTRRFAPLFVVILLALLVTPLKAQTGELQVTVTTTGMSPDVGRYVVALDFQSRAIGANDSVVFAEVLEGAHTVTLLDVPESCTVGRSNPREAVVAADEVAAVRFAVVCALPGMQERQRVRAEAAGPPPVERDAQRVEEAPAAEEVASEAISGYWDDPLSVGGLPFPGNVVARLRVPAGSFVVFAKMVVIGEDDANGRVGCNLIAGGDGDQAATVWARPPPGALASKMLGDIPRTIALNVVHTFPLPGEVLLQCWADTVGETDGYRFNGVVEHIKITAIRVGKLTNQRLEKVD